MSKYPSVLFAAIVACLLLYFFPINTAYEQQDQIAYNVAYKATTNFVDAVRNKGYVTPTMYNDFTKELNSISNIYDIQMEHKSKKYNPVYTDPADQSTFQNKADVYYDEFFQDDILAAIFPDNKLPVTDETRKYRLKVGDFFSVTVKNKNITNATVMKDFLTNGNTGDPTRIYIPYGGMVQNEDY